MRFAPAPSGFLHVGNVRAGLYNWLHARRHGGQFILRIEDTDVTRATEGSMRTMIDALRWIALEWDDGPEVGGPYGPYRQSDRRAFYAAIIRRLLAAGVAYEDYASPEELTEYREAQRAAGQPPIIKGAVRGAPRAGEESFPSVRVRTPVSGEILVNDLVRGEVRFDWANIGDFVVQRADGTATYPLANAADDIAQGMTLICRGEDLLSVTPRQLLLYEELTRDGLVDAALAETDLPAREPHWRPPEVFAHLPLIVGEDRKPLSKRHGAVAVEEFAAQGYLPEVLLNYLALLGWSPGDGRERLRLDELIESFDISAVGRTPAAFDPGKLTAFNGERIRELDPDELVDRLVPYLDGTYGEAFISSPPSEDELDLLRRLVPLVQERMERLDEVRRHGGFVFRREIELDPKAVDKVLGDPEAVAALEAAAEALAFMDEWSTASIERVLRELPERLGVGPRRAFQPIRVAVTGSTVSPPLFESLALLPRGWVLDRIRAAIAVAEKAAQS
ncbi:MAG: glutamate--tRNA ligase [Actinomycetota bacterium]|nr:glutamate--tRNA ligase [Actinomycetota bacterium]